MDQAAPPPRRRIFPDPDHATREPAPLQTCRFWSEPSQQRPPLASRSPPISGRGSEYLILRRHKLPSSTVWDPQLQWLPSHFANHSTKSWNECRHLRHVLYVSVAEFGNCSRSSLFA